MAKVTYAQMTGIKSVLESWWTVKGLPWPFLQQLSAVAQVIVANTDTFEKMRQKFIADYVEKDEDGTAKFQDGVPMFTDPKTADAEWGKLIAIEFDCPTLATDELATHADKLGITLGAMLTIKPLLVDTLATVSNGN